MGCPFLATKTHDKTTKCCFCFLENTTSTVLWLSSAFEKSILELYDVLDLENKVEGYEMLSAAIALCFFKRAIQRIGCWFSWLLKIHDQWYDGFSGPSKRRFAI